MMSCSYSPQLKRSTRFVLQTIAGSCGDGTTNKVPTNPFKPPQTFSHELERYNEQPKTSAAELVPCTTLTLWPNHNRRRASGTRSSQLAQRAGLYRCPCPLRRRHEPYLLAAMPDSPPRYPFTTQNGKAHVNGGWRQRDWFLRSMMGSCRQSRVVTNCLFCSGGFIEVVFLSNCFFRLWFGALLCSL